MSAEDRVLYEPAAGARTAASLLLVRDGALGLEVLMLRRAERAGDQRSGAAVFPGGVLDARDGDAYAHCLGNDDVAWSQRLGVSARGQDYLVAAVRETFEEVGLLLACHADGRSPGPADLARLKPWRDRLQDGSASAADFCAAEGLQLDLRGLVYMAHWLTPPGAPKRFDTRFFIRLAPDHQEAQADLGEAVELMWLTPAQALERERGLVLLPVTRRTLQDLGRHRRAADAMAWARGLGQVPLIMPRRAASERGLRVVLPDELPYAEVGKLDPQGQGTAHADLVAGRAVRLSPRIVRVTAPNPGPMTGPGTNTYLVSHGLASDAWTVIDPGPANAEHVRAIQAAVPGRIVQILVTHTHKDHSPGAVPLAAATGAPVMGRRPAHPLWQDESFAPSQELQGGERLSLGPDTTLEVVHTPGHASNHLCYLLVEEKLLFTGDHVMQGSTVVINPPDGDMAAYLASLRALQSRGLEWLAPGHGFLVAQPNVVLQGLVAHRLRREAKVAAALDALRAGSVDNLLPRVYEDVPAALHAVARRSLLAHLIKLQQDGRAASADGDHWSVA
jgi:glyoxylase-like metal-dependent hydrolase (beta-lactamase superfamily II)/8-oxo-dGTP pyrophosphatase MutT (NUDIX family)